MHTLNRIGVVCAVIAMGALAACTPENREKKITDRQDAAKEAVVFPAVVEAAQSPAAEDDHTIQSVLYHFKAKIMDVYAFPFKMKKPSNGIVTIRKRHYVFSESSQSWVVKLRVIKIDKPIWFMEPGKIIRFMVHSPGHLFGKPDAAAIGEVREFTFNVSLRSDGTPRFGLLHTPGGTGRHGMPADAAESGDEPQAE